MTIDQAKSLISFADSVEDSGVKTSLYYRLYPQIIEARALVAAEGGSNAS